MEVLEARLCQISDTRKRRRIILHVVYALAQGSSSSFLHKAQRSSIACVIKATPRHLYLGCHYHQHLTGQNKALRSAGAMSLWKQVTVRSDRLRFSAPVPAAPLSPIGESP